MSYKSKTESVKIISMEKESTIVLENNKALFETWKQRKQKSWEYITKCSDICEYVAIERT